MVLYGFGITAEVSFATTLKLTVVGVFKQSDSLVVGCCKLRYASCIIHLAATSSDALNPNSRIPSCKSFWAPSVSSALKSVFFILNAMTWG